MTNLQELIDTANTLSNNLEKAAYDEKKFCVDICIKLEIMSWETFRLANELKQIRDYV
jgi:hypothetical protein